MSTQEARVYNGRYEIVRHIAKGGMAEVYQAKDQLLDRAVALKVLSPELSVDPTFVERFRREAQAAANLSHQSIVGIYDWGEDEGTYFIVMEYIEGRPLSQLLRTEGRLPPNKAAQIAAGTAAALSYAHRHGVQHRDVKPGNILLDDNGGIKVTDFGIARAGDKTDDLTQTGIVMGTATYFSPEQAQGFETDARTDIYSLGVVLYEMVCGRPPFTGETPVAIAYQHVKDEPESPRKVEPSVPADLETVILTAMEKDRDLRYPSAEELRADLIRFGRGQTPKAVRIRAGRTGEPVAPAPAADATTALAAGAAVAAATVALPLGDATTAMGAAPVDAPPVHGEPSEAKDRTALYAGTSVVLLVILCLLAFFLYRLVSGGGDTGSSTVAVTSVVDQPQADAQRELEAQGLEVVVAQGSDPAKAIGIVLSQDPAAGTQVAARSKVTIVVNAASNQAEVPRVVNLPQADATRTLEEAGFGVTAVLQKNPGVTAGLVFAQTPEPKVLAEKGSKVTITVSTGDGLGPVPDVTGLPQDEAIRRLTEAGYTPRTRPESSATVPSGNVTRTDPVAGTQPKPGATTITVYVSSGATTTTAVRVTVPNVVGMTEDGARGTLEGRGFVVQVNESTGGTPGRVKAQSPGGGSTADKGSTVVITVSTGSSTSTTDEPATTTTRRSTTTTTSAPPSSSTTSTRASVVP